MVVLLTRPAEQSAEIAGLLEQRGIETLIWPLTRFVRLAGRADIPAGTEALIFTSGQAVRTFADLSGDLALPVLCVGQRTADLARAAGFAEVSSADGTVRSLADLAGTLCFRRYHYLRGRETRSDLRTLLPDPATTLTEQVLYGADPAGPPESVVDDALCKGRISVVTLWSRRNSGLFRDHVTTRPDWAISSMTAVGISESALEPLESLEFGRILVAQAPTGQAVVDTVVAALRQ